LLSTALNGASEILKLDPEGRIQLSDAMRSHAGIGEAVTFVGQGHKFQMWAPQAFAAHFAQARGKLREVRAVLSSRVVASGGSSGAPGS
jgi:MraZ protein